MSLFCLLIALSFLAPDRTIAEGMACVTCHAASAEMLHPGSEASGASCSDCHGEDTGHPPAPTERSPGLMTYGDEPAQARATACEGCHEATHGGATSLHANAGVACNDCHAVHETPERRPPIGFERIDDASALCSDCHADVFTRFAFSERHRLADGAVSCVSCHDPHGGAGGALHDTFGSASCADCHQAQAGPFVYEHDASRVEGCSACHEPHGSPNPYLLTHARQGELCYSCHIAVPQFHIGFAPGAPPRFDLDTPCTECHVAIHGSNLDAGLLR